MHPVQAPRVLVFLSGLFAGVLHVISGPDHLAAIAPLTVRAPGKAPALGAAWGIGHGGGVAAWFLGAGLLRALYGVQLAPDALEALVGLSLIALGIANWRERPAHHHARRGPLVAFAFGMLHGSAGGSHLLALLPTLGLPAAGVVIYAAGYLSAGVVAMAIAAMVLGQFSASLPRLHGLRRVCAAFAAGLGALWLYGSLSNLA
jgi:hypothetical protein